MNAPRHLTQAELEAGLDHIRQAPAAAGQLELIVRRPAVDAREVLAAGELDERAGLVGDTWSARPSARTADGGPHPEMQLTLMNARVIALLAQTREHWALAGDQLFVDLDLSTANLPAGTRLRIGQAVVEVTAEPHTGCAKFSARFGREALIFVNGPAGKALRLRGLNARIVQSGRIAAGDAVIKLA